MARNRLLAVLPPHIAEALVADGTRRPLRQGEVLHEQDEPVDHIVFPESGAVSAMAAIADGREVEAAMVGREGAVGFPSSAGGLSPWRSLVQSSGEGIFVPGADFERHLATSPEFERLMSSFAGTLLALASQSTACNRFHELPERLARWLLITHDRAESDEFRMTHQFMAQMLGAHRPSVSLAVRVFQRAGLIDLSRGRVRIIDRAGVEDAACECYGRIRQRYDALLPG